MFIRKTVKEDLDNIEFNEFVRIDKAVVQNSLDFQNVYTCIDNGKITAIIGFFEFYPNCYKCWFLGSKHLNRYSLRSIKNFMLNECQKRCCVRLETEGFNNKILERFHKYLGFKKEIIIDNGGYIKWVL